MWHTRACSDSQDGDDEVHCIPERCIAVILRIYLFVGVYRFTSTFSWVCTFRTIKICFSNVLCPWKDYCCGTFRLVNLLPTLDNIPMDGLLQRQNNELNPSNPFHLLVKNYTVRGEETDILREITTRCYLNRWMFPQGRQHRLQSRLAVLACKNNIKHTKHVKFLEIKNSIGMMYELS